MGDIMTSNCTCSYCSNGVKEKFCLSCGNDFNDCESIYEVLENHPGDLPRIAFKLCPRCCHQNWKPEIYLGYEVIKVHPSNEKQAVL